MVFFDVFLQRFSIRCQFPSTWLHHTVKGLLPVELRLHLDWILAPLPKFLQDLRGNMPRFQVLINLLLI